MSDRLYINVDSLHAAAAQLGATGELAKKSMRTAVQRVSRWASNEAKRRIGKAANVTGKVIKGRMAVFLDDSGGRVWVGLKPVPLNRLKPRQTGSGVIAGPAKRPGAFIIGKFGGHVFQREGRSRFPIHKADPHPIEDQGRAALFSIADELEPRLLKAFEDAFLWHSR